MNNNVNTKQKNAPALSQNLTKTVKFKIIELAESIWQHDLRNRIISGLITLSVGAIGYLLFTIFTT
jgi:hypothetical protein